MKWIHQGVSMCYRHIYLAIVSAPSSRPTCSRFDPGNLDSSWMNLPARQRSKGTQSEDGLHCRLAHHLDFRQITLMIALWRLISAAQIAQDGVSSQAASE